MKLEGISARKLSLESGLNETAVKAILSGKSQHPRHDTLEKLAARLRCSVDDLLGKQQSARPERQRVIENLRDALRAAGVNLAELAEDEPTDAQKRARIIRFRPKSGG